MPSPEPFAPGETPGTLVEVLGLVVAGRVTTLGWLADDSAHAPDAHTRIELARLAAAQLAGHEELVDAVRAHGGDLGVVAGPHLEIFRDITERTRPADWWERLLRTAVAGGMLHDLAAQLLERLPDGQRPAGVAAAVREHLDLVVDLTTRATAEHPSLAGRLALWGRRVAGEALGVVQPALALVSGGADLGDLGTQIPGVLSAEHARRMDRLGLAA